MSRVAVVTGASRGVGRGVAAELANQGWQVFATGRSIAGAQLPAGVRRITCDHANDRDVEAAFAALLEEAGRIDVLVNGVWGGYERMVDQGGAARLDRPPVALGGAEADRQYDLRRGQGHHGQDGRRSSPLSRESTGSSTWMGSRRVR